MMAKQPTPGFTLIELLVTIAIAAILLSLAAPSFRTLVLNNRVSGQVDGFVNGLNYARNAALSSNVPTKVCPIDPTAPANSTNCGTTWSTGWIAATNPPTGSGTLLQSFTATPGRPVLSPVAISGVTPTIVNFDSRGLAGALAHFVVCDSRGGSFARSVQTQATGFVQSGPKVGKSVWDGASLVCP